MNVKTHFFLRLSLGLLAILPLAILLTWGGYLVYVVWTNDWNLVVYAVEHHPVLLSLFNLGLTVIPSVPLVYYLFEASRNSALADRRVAWILLIIFLTSFALPIYWYLFIWSDRHYESEGS